MVIRRVLLDAFGTVFSPREPVFRQYAAVARSFGLQVQEDEVKDAFKQAFQKWAKLHPLYGKHSSPPLDSSQWWSGVIGDTFRQAGVPASDFEPVERELCDTLVRRFWGKEGYKVHDDCAPFLCALHNDRKLPPPAIVSNTDTAVFKILDSLGVTAPTFEPSEAGIKQDEIWTTWELEKEKRSVEFWEEVMRRLRKTSREAGEAELSPSEVLVVGDEFESDYEAPRKAGLRSLLLRRPASNGQHARASYQDDETGLRSDETVASLMDVVEYIKRENEEARNR
ncbi:haloacid dehalogenase-like hydrolase [Rhodotorula toruloides]|uniref:BY PROTMAP: gi/472587409/gb/EMS24908.1/ haloacid dehalogenase-like hydrolase [Rhodosporidium toruloides NP11] gi/647401340/emb/CDR47514.1/ RHTO0S14e04588g1_1 [Rhodosporidium toruloides] n=1 Tax=Rhodotorula toruloides TaxID=5286 RepID=A0A0K3CAI8_RHOTO|nr:haloacid dehalogenase-like hydrolase [Rhodotorula toruloides]PRQ77267.1 HAD-like domain-containing protein [Rhodotorula toruloides]